MYLGAPRGSGIKGITSELSAVRISSSSGRSSSRSIPYSNLSEVQPQAIEKQGKLINSFFYFFLSSLIFSKVRVVIRFFTSFYLL